MRVRHGRLGALVAAVVVVVLGVTASPASAAVAAFSAPVLLRKNCQELVYSTTSSTGTTRGVLLCTTAATSTGDELVFFTGNGVSWSKVRTGVRGRPFAFADDGTSYFAMYEPPGTSKGAVYLLRRNRSTGAQTRITLRGPSSSTPLDYLLSGALLVSGGKYWAAFTINNGAILDGRTLTKQNLVPSLPSTFPGIYGQQPALTRRGTTGVTMVLRELRTIVMHTTKADGTWGTTRIRTGADCRQPQVRWASGVTQISWIESTSPLTERVVYQDNASGGWKRTAVPGLGVGNASTLKMFATGGKLTFTWSGAPDASVRSDTRIAIAQRSAGVWSTASINRAADGNVLLSAGGWSGKTIVLYASRSTTGLVSRRQA